jgi:hypothetical protein
MFLFVVGASSWLIGLFGQEFSGNAELVVIVAGAFIVQAAGTVTAGVLIGVGRSWMLALVHVVWGVAMLALAWPVVEAGGARSLAFLLLFSYAPIVVILTGSALAPKFHAVR